MAQAARAREARVVCSPTFSLSPSRTPLHTGRKGRGREKVSANARYEKYTRVMTGTTLAPSLSLFRARVLFYGPRRTRLLRRRHLSPPLSTSLSLISLASDIRITVCIDTCVRVYVSPYRVVVLAGLQIWILSQSCELETRLKKPQRRNVSSAREYLYMPCVNMCVCVGGVEVGVLEPI